MSDERWRDISRLYDEAAALAPVDRAPFLRKACSGDEALRAEIESLLRDDTRVNELLEPKGSHRALIGQRIGSYEIRSLLGVGGMGEVYRARDTRLGRDVAIKILPPLFTSNPDRLARFEREARVLASLNHPHIGAIYGLEDADGMRALVLELVEGETLADLIAHGPIPVPDALTIARQIAEALDAAHEKGIIHRDLKPANIKVTPDGIVKVLDFGLARIVSANDGSTSDSGPTITIEGTREGLVMGTAAYMSPEQARGKTVDKRTDIWAFGCVVYEMLTGRIPFAGETVSDTIAVILEREPDWSRLPASTPANILRLLRRCLQKDAKRRLHDIGDARIELDDSPGDAAHTAPVARPALWRRLWPWVGGAVAGSLITGLVMYELLRSPAVRPTVRALIAAPQDSQFISVGTQAGPAVLSPDGRRLAFVASSSDGRPHLWIRSLDSLAMHSLTGTEGASQPFWSADNEQLGFFADRKLKKVSISGGAVMTLTEANHGAGGTWNRDGTIVFSSGLRGGLLRVSSAGGAPRSATVLNTERHESTHRWPVFLPDGRRFLYSVGQETQAGRWTIRMASLDSDRVEDLIEGHSNAAYANGSLIFARNGTLVAQPVDEGSLRPTGDPVSLAENVLHDVVLGRAVFSASQTGTLVYQVGSADAGSRLVWLDRTGKEVGVLAETCFCIWPHLSPDGLRAAVAVTDASTGNGDIWIHQLADGRRSHLTFEEALEANPLWTADGSRIVFTSTRRGFRDIHWKDALGSGSQEPLLESDRDKTVHSVSSDGRWAVFVQDRDLWLLPLAGEHKPQPLLVSEHRKLFGQISPDGRWLLYQSEESGKMDVWITSFPVRAGKWKISENGGLLPKWSSNGREIFYLTPDHTTLFAAAVSAQGESIHVLSVDRLFSATMVAGRGYPYDVSPDGERFLVVASSGATTTPLTLVVDWPSELNR